MISVVPCWRAKRCTGETTPAALAVSVSRDRFYLELQRTGRENEENYIVEAVEPGARNRYPGGRDQRRAFSQVRIISTHTKSGCAFTIGRTLDDPRRTQHYSDQQYLRSVEEMQALFADIPEALENTVEIAQRCNLVDPTG